MPKVSSCHEAKTIKNIFIDIRNMLESWTLLDHYQWELKSLEDKYCQLVDKPVKDEEKANA